MNDVTPERILIGTVRAAGVVSRLLVVGVIALGACGEDRKKDCDENKGDRSYDGHESRIAGFAPNGGRLAA
jgi:hypothetical protein